jgi:hypothetical protein
MHIPNITKATPATIKLGDTDLDVFQLRDGSYAALGLFRLYTTSIYRYQDQWYWLSPNGHPNLKARDRWDWNRGGILAFQGTRLCYVRVEPIDPEGGLDDSNLEDIYSPVPKEIGAVLDFCEISDLIPDDVMSEMRRLFQDSYSNDKLIRRVSRQSLLRDTAIYIPPHLL